MQRRYYSRTPLMSAALTTLILPNITLESLTPRASTTTTITMERPAAERVWNLPELVCMILDQLNWSDKYRAGCANEVARAELQSAFAMEARRGNPFFGWTDFDQFVFVQAWLLKRQRQVRQLLVYLEPLALFGYSLCHWIWRGLYRRLDSTLWIDVCAEINHDMPLPPRARP